MPHGYTALLIAVALAVLGGCGQTGPLYMPAPEAPPQAQPPASGEPIDTTSPAT